MTKRFLQLTHLSLSRAGQQLLLELDLAVSEGEKIAVVGPNGAGKSSLLRAISGLNRRYTGSLTLDGTEVSDISPDKLSHLVSLVPQRLEFVPRFTVKEFLQLSGGVDLGRVDPTVSQLLDRYLPDLSGGELQRVVIAGAVAQGARLLLLDEPTAHLDPTGRSEVERVIARCHEEKRMSYLLVTHDIAFGIRAAERVLVMKDGRIVWDGATSDPGLLGILRSAYECSFSRFVNPDTGESIVTSG